MFQYKNLYIPLVTIILSFILIAGLAIYTYTVQKRVYLEGIDKQLKQAADTAELYLGSDFIDRYTTSTPPSEETYRHYLNQLSLFTDSNGIQYIYMMVQDSKGVYIVFSSATQTEIEEGTYDSFYALYEPSQHVLKGFQDKKPFFVSESDKYGSFRSYCKYGVSPQGKVYMVGADIPLDVLDNFITNLIRFYSYVFAILTLLVGFIFYIYYTLFQKNRYLNNLAIIDKLTGLFNRQKLDDELLNEQAKIESSDSYHCSCLLLDIDHFKSINDNHGHLEGDRVLQEISRMMESFFRSNDVIGRWGGEEFLILLPSTKIEDARILAEKLCRKVESHFKDSLIPITVSIGVGFLSSGILVRQSLNDIDLALYKAKKNGRNRVEIIHID